MRLGIWRIGCTVALCLGAGLWPAASRAVSVTEEEAGQVAAIGADLGSGTGAAPATGGASAPVETGVPEPTGAGIGLGGCAASLDWRKLVGTLGPGGEAACGGSGEVPISLSYHVGGSIRDLGAGDAFLSPQGHLDLPWQLERLVEQRAGEADRFAGDLQAGMALGGRWSDLGYRAEYGLSLAADSESHWTHLGAEWGGLGPLKPRIDLEQSLFRMDADAYESGASRGRVGLDLQVPGGPILRLAYEMEQRGSQGSGGQYEQVDVDGVRSELYWGGARGWASLGTSLRRTRDELWGANQVAHEYAASGAYRPLDQVELRPSLWLAREQLDDGGWKVSQAARLEVDYLPPRLGLKLGLASGYGASRDSARTVDTRTIDYSVRVETPLARIVPRAAAGQMVSVELSRSHVRDGLVPAAGYDATRLFVQVTLAL